VPVLLVPATSTPSWPAQSPRIGVPLDGSEVAARALGPALGLAGIPGGLLLLLGVVDPGPSTIAAATGLARYDLGPGQEAAGAYLDDVAAGLRKDGWAVATRTAHGTPASPIADPPVAEPVDAIAISQHPTGA